MPNNTSYIIRTKGNSGIPAKFNSTGPNNITRGESATFLFEFGKFGNDLTVSDTHTIGSNQVEVYGLVTVEDSATLVVDGVLRANEVNNQGTLVVNGELIANDGLGNAFEDFINWAGNYTTQEDLNGVVRYSETIPTNIDIDSIAVGIEPNNTLQTKNVNGCWGLIDSIEMDRPKSLQEYRYQVNVTVLALYETYDNHTNMESELNYA